MTEPMRISAFFDETSHTVSYLVVDPATRAAAIIDAVLDYDHRAGRADVTSAGRILAVAEQLSARVEWVLETHVHADHLTAAPWLKAKTGAKTGIGAEVAQVQKIFRPVFDLADVSLDGAEFDRLFADGDHFAIGGLDVEVLHTPGHTPACVSYRIGDAVFVGDTVFMPDYGAARADFPGGSARALYRSIRRLLALPPETRMFLCHDYKPPGRDHFVWETTVAAQRAENVQVHDGVSEEEFVAMRHKRDAELAAPELLLPSIQVNIRAGRFPRAESQGARFLRIPVKLAPELDAVV
ncbi:glyoxylase-like metal-dependent hydrolase (beta-lactamase superfamily II) [Rhodoblastus acidophilus]|uniref:MBL fold metallo-hydrolase n=1 Tax=Rhodoblastus acidophilus TaxID=1074 RepID=UPI0022255F0E|nr:MBL fold metallo-hydrolase [Rhodoblastus acidophilus]MCW2285129.1 glyoxylase-like metal-dependent hydrolase (beta-lactamase superfamily II) [Rhodoblastus acidophilus]MCW2334013.1 glyoxylase-like metal-dependent hydrolase (beta-lactamase superfamily II) [Rhodoblastus acidophilus]